jgi:hypothetical protein
MSIRDRGGEPRRPVPETDAAFDTVCGGRDHPSVVGINSPPAAPDRPLVDADGSITV